MVSPSLSLWTAVRQPWSRFQLPPRQTQRAVFPHCAFLFASCQGLWDLSRWERFLNRPTTNLIAVEQLQVLVQVAPTPPLPAKASPIPGSPHLTPEFLFYPVFDEAEAFAGVSNGEVVHPASQHRIDRLNHPICGLGLISPEHILELRGPSLLPRQVYLLPNMPAFAGHTQPDVKLSAHRTPVRRPARNIDVPENEEIHSLRRKPLRNWLAWIVWPLLELSHHPGQDCLIDIGSKGYFADGASRL